MSDGYQEYRNKVQRPENHYQSYHAGFLAALKVVRDDVIPLRHPEDELDGIENETLQAGEEEWIS